MTSELAALILEDLVRGFDPMTGQALADESPVCQPLVRKALELAIGCLRFRPREPEPRQNWNSLKQKRQQQQIARKRVRPHKTTSWQRPLERSQAGKKWTPENDCMLLAGIRSGLTVEELAKRFGRGVKSIEVRLLKLGIRTDPC